MPQGHNWVKRSENRRGAAFYCVNCGISSVEVKPVGTTPATIIGMQVLRDPVLEYQSDGLLKVIACRETLFVARSDGVFERCDDGVFRELEFRRAGSS